MLLMTELSLLPTESAAVRGIVRACERHEACDMTRADCMIQSSMTQIMQKL